MSVHLIPRATHSQRLRKHGRYTSATASEILAPVGFNPVLSSTSQLIAYMQTLSVPSCDKSRRKTRGKTRVFSRSSICQNIRRKLKRIVLIIITTLVSPNKGDKYITMTKVTPEMNKLTLKVLVTTIDAQWEGMGDVGSASDHHQNISLEFDFEAIL